MPLFIAPPFNMGEAFALAEAIRVENVPVPAVLERGLHIAQTVIASRTSEPVDLLTLTDQQISDYVSEVALRTAPVMGGMGNSFESAAHRVAQEALEATAAALRNGDIDQVIIDLRTPFDRAAKIIEVAAKLGIRSTTTPGEIIDRDETNVTAAYRALKPALSTLDRIATLRVHISNTLQVSPTREETANLAGLSLTMDATYTDHSVSFAAGDNWTIEPPKRNAHFDWLALATAGLRLNTPAEVKEKFTGRRRRESRPLVANGIVTR